jgi:hypothetical protein
VNDPPGFVPIDDGRDGVYLPEADQETHAENERKGDYLSGLRIGQDSSELFAQVEDDYGTSDSLLD